MIYDCAVIGAGPAGIIASIQLKRYGYTVILFEKKQLGGLLRNANNIENYLGFSKGISGKDLGLIFSKHLHSFGIEPVKAEVISIKKQTVFEICTKTKTYKAKSVLIATGTIPKKLKIPGEDELVGSKVFYEIADLPFHGAKKEILIIGGGDVAFDYALNLSEGGHNPTIIMRSVTQCLPILKKRADKKKIIYVENVTPLSIQNKSKVEVICANKTFKADAVLIAVGREPITPYLEVLNTDGLFFAGDVKNKKYKQIHIATGDALKTAMNIAHYLQNAHKKRDWK